MAEAAAAAPAESCVGDVFFFGFDHYRTSGVVQAKHADAVTRPSIVRGVGATSLDAGDGHVVALAQHRQVWTWGANTFGQLGHGATGAAQGTPKRVDRLSGGNVIAVAAGALHSLALLDDGRVFAWGDNSSRQLGRLRSSDDEAHIGDGWENVRSAETREMMISKPMAVLTIASAEFIAACQTFSLAALADGRVVWWGMMPNKGPATPPSTTTCATPQLLGKLPQRCVSLGTSASLAWAILADGTAWIFGQHCGLIPGRLEITRYNALSKEQEREVIVSIAAGVDHALVLVQGGRVYGVGPDTPALGLGDPGDNYMMQRSKPAPDTVQPSLILLNPVISSVSITVVEIAVGEKHSLLLLSDRRILAAGDNYWGQLGTGTRDSTSEFVDVTMPRGVPVTRLHGAANASIFLSGRAPTLSLAMADLLQHRQFADIVLLPSAADAAAPCPAHRAVLAARAPCLAAQLRDVPDDAHVSAAELHSALADPAVLRTVLTWLYTDQISVRKANDVQRVRRPRRSGSNRRRGSRSSSSSSRGKSSGTNGVGVMQAVRRVGLDWGVPRLAQACAAVQPRAAGPNGVGDEDTQLIRVANHAAEAAAASLQAYRDALLSLLQTGMLSDITVVVAEQEIPLHRAILCARSDYFAAMLDSGMDEAMSGRVVIRSEDATPRLMRLAFEFLYSDDIADLQGDDCVPLLLLAHEFGLSDLVDVLESVAVAALDSVNAAFLLLVARRCNATYLAGSAMHFASAMPSSARHNLPMWQDLPPTVRSRINADGAAIAAQRPHASSRQPRSAGAGRRVGELPSRNRFDDLPNQGSRHVCCCYLC